MDLRKLQRVVIDALDDIKAQDIRVFNTTDQTELFDRLIIATAGSNRQTRALASHVRDKVKAAGGEIISVEGEESGEWVLVDLGDAVVHIMQPAIRAYYHLEELWGSKPVNVRIGPPSTATKTASRKAASPRSVSASATAKTTADRTGADESAAARSAGTRSTRRTAKPSAAPSNAPAKRTRRSSAEGAPASPRARKRPAKT